MTKAQIDKYLHIRMNLQRLVRKDRYYALRMEKWERMELEHNVWDIIHELDELAKSLQQ